MYCGKCGKPIDGKFCSNCGAPASKTEKKTNDDTNQTTNGFDFTQDSTNQQFNNFNSTTNTTQNQKAKRPFYKRPWIWILLGIVVFSIYFFNSVGSFFKTFNNTIDDYTDLYSNIYNEYDYSEKTTTNVSTQTSKGNNATGIRADVKEAIDSYEAFIDEYLQFCIKYSTTSNPSNMLQDYMNYMQKLVSMESKFDAISKKDLTTEEKRYWTDTQLRCSTKLMQASAYLAGQG